MDGNDDVRRLIGSADACELLALAFSFPTDDLAAALADGRFGQDVVSCLEDAGASLAFADEVSFNEDGLADRLKKGYSILFLSPGADTPVFPYESAFRFVSGGREGVPPIFNSPITLDVERHMREAGVLPISARREPADSVRDELSFMSYLYGNAAKALHENREVDAAKWLRRAVCFWEDHASMWLLDFMEKVVQEAPKHPYGAEYAALAKVGLVVLDVICEGGEARKAT